MKFTLRLALPLFTTITAIAAQVSSLDSPIVDLGYTKYEGTSQANGQNQFLGMRFAAPPLGNLRFRAPRPPLPTREIQPAKAFGPVCLAVGRDIMDGFSEDCLFVNVWAPKTATSRSKLPVFVWISGGGYVSLSNVNYNGSDLVTATNNSMVFVNFNYRVGPYGFLASEKIRRNGDLNVGLLDQRFLLEWVQTHITAFGGDPRHVVLVGVSAGAGSVANHLVAYGGLPTNLFAGVFGISPFFPTQRRISELEWQFDLFASRAGCGNAKDPLTCLRSQNSTTLQNANIGMAYPGRQNNAFAAYTPAIDGFLLVDFPYRLFEEGRFVNVPAVFGDDTDEGTIFVPDAATPAEVSSFLMDNFPELSSNDTDAINSLYPVEIPNPFPTRRSFFASAAAAYGETTFICPGLTMSAAIARHTKSWNYRFNVLTPGASIGVKHASETGPLFSSANTGTSSDTLTRILQSYYTSFVRTLNPNAQLAKGAVTWPEFNLASNQRLLIQADATTVETVPAEQLKRCEFWKRLAIKMEQ